MAYGCAECPQLRCEKPGCGTQFCYHCKQIWHPNLTCEIARVRRTPADFSIVSSELSGKDEIKACPRCGIFILKADDGSCNHMSCRLCGAEFCWLCMKLVTDVHYLSPSGCTFWGKKRWSRKKKLVWQLGLLAGAPVGIVLLTAIAVPAIIAGFPVWTGKRIRQRRRNWPKAKRNAAIVGGVIGATIASPAIAAATVGVGVPVLLAYVYGVVPISLCKSGSVGAKEPSNKENSNQNNPADVDDIIAALREDKSSKFTSGDKEGQEVIGALSVVSIDGAISEDRPGDFAWQLTSDSERVTLDGFSMANRLFVGTKNGQDETTDNSLKEPSIAASSNVSAVVIQNGTTNLSRKLSSISYESLGLSNGCRSEDRFSAVCQPDTASGSVRGLSGSMSKLSLTKRSSSKSPKPTSSMVARDKSSVQLVPEQ